MVRSVVMAGLLLGLAPILCADSGDALPLNAAVLKFCESKVGQRVGSGECSHLANEALRVSGAEFTQVGKDGKRIPDSPADGDYVWGSHVKTYTVDAKTKKVVDSDPTAKIQPGDILQYRDVVTSNGSKAPHHTAIVRVVDKSGNPTDVYQQNVNSPKGGDGRVVQKTPFQPTKLTAGRVMAYRPEPASNPSAIQITLTNNTKTKSVEYTFTDKVEKLGAPNTAGGFVIIWGGKNLESLTVGGEKFSIETRKGYEFYETSGGKVAVREVK
jgi:hypothetical protein